MYETDSSSYGAVGLDTANMASTREYKSAQNVGVYWDSDSLHNDSGINLYSRSKGTGYTT